MRPFATTALYLLLSLGLLAGEAPDPYQIGPEAGPKLEGRSAYQIISDHLATHPELEKRLLDPNHTIPNESWSYHTQTYGDRAVMRHLIALQIKTMAERGAIDTIKDIFDPEHGIGSKDHKDKGTINNPLSIWGHPVQNEVLGQKSRLKALKVYHAFRETIKNDLIRYGRNQPLEWHLKIPEERFTDTLLFLETKHPDATRKLKKKLQQWDLRLDLLLYAALRTNLLS